MFKIAVKFLAGGGVKGENNRGHGPSDSLRGGKIPTIKVLRHDHRVQQEIVVRVSIGGGGDLGVKKGSGWLGWEKSLQTDERVFARIYRETMSYHLLMQFQVLISQRWR